MKPRVANFVVLAVLSFVASVSIILEQSPSESGQRPPLPSPAEQERGALVETVLLRTTVKVRITRDVIAGRLSLAQAAALVGELNRIPPQAATLRFRFPAYTDEELLCQQVIEYVRCELDGASPDHREAALARLEGDFKELPKDGVIRLPNLLTLVPIEKLLEQARLELIDQGVLRRAGAKNYPPPGE